MKREKLEDLIGRGLSTHKIAAELECGQTSVRYWLNKYGLKTQVSAGKACEVCGDDLKGNQTKFCSANCRNTYWQGYNTTSSGRLYDMQKSRGLKRKLDLVKKAGGKCIKCGYSKNLAALHFHHLSDKSFQLDVRNLSNRKWSDILDEFQKCVLVCGVCHAEHHHPELEMNLLLLGEHDDDK